MFSKTLECCLNCFIFYFHFLFSFFNRDVLFLSVTGMLFSWLFYIGLHRQQWMPYALYPWSSRSASCHYEYFFGHISKSVFFQKLIISVSLWSAAKRLAYQCLSYFSFYCGGFIKKKTESTPKLCNESKL